MKHHLFILGLLLHCGLVSASEKQAPLQVKFVSAEKIKENPNNNYFAQLLTLVLDKSQDHYGDYRLLPVDIDISQSRQIREIQKGKISVFWTMTTYQREAELLPIRIPLTKGMYGLRIFAVNNKDTEMFAHFQQQDMPEMLTNITRYKAISGRDWPDTAVMRVNRLEVISDIAENDMYDYIHRYQGNYFPRGLTELFSEIDQRTQLNIQAEPYIGLMYPAAIYFFVKKDNIALAERIEYGLTKAMADGSFDALFYNFPEHKKAFSMANLGKRRFIQLQNPLFPKTGDAKQLTKMQQEIIQRFSKP